MTDSLPGVSWILSRLFATSLLEPDFPAPGVSQPLEQAEHTPESLVGSPSQLAFSINWFLLMVQGLALCGDKCLHLQPQDNSWIQGLHEPDSGS
jgi:hypothetical protein